MTIRVALVDDQQLVRGGFRMLIDSQPDLEIVAEASNGLEAIEVLRETIVDVILMDVRMPEMNGIDATKAILSTEYESTPRIIVLTTFSLDEYVLEAIQAGASGFLLKDAAPEDLLQAIRQVHSGDAVISPAMTRRLLHHVQPLLGADSNPGNESSGQQPAGTEPINTVNQALVEVAKQLTNRETEVLRLISGGLSNQEIAAHLVLSEATVKTHVAHILQKTSSRDRVQAVVFAFESGLVGGNVVDG